MMPAQKMSLDGIMPWLEADLNDQWRPPEQWTPDTDKFAVYESFGNWNVHSKNAAMYVRFKGPAHFTLYINSYAESSYDFTIAYKADSETDEAAKTQSFQADPSKYPVADPQAWKAVVYNVGVGEHFVKIVYRKDGSYSQDWDRGYVAVPLKLEK